LIWFAANRNEIGIGGIGFVDNDDEKAEELDLPGSNR